MSTVLVTGGSGFIGSYIVMQLLAAGHQVRTTVRSRARERALNDTLRKNDVDPGGLSYFIADLERDAGWAEAVAGCDYVLHVASPLPPGVPKDENELIIPACQGTLRVLKAARDAGVKRVVLTSSFAAIGYGHKPQEAPFDETMWTKLGTTTSAYVKSKMLAERAAWDFIASEGGALELSVINPVGVFGPVLGAEYSSSILLLKSMLEGVLPAVPRLYFGVVDVRDVAELHILAMTHESARGQRFLASAGDCLSMFDIAKILKRRMGKRGEHVPEFQLPDWLVRFIALWNPVARQALPELGKVKHMTNAKARRVLGWIPRSNEDAIVATAESLYQLQS